MSDGIDCPDCSDCNCDCPDCSDCNCDSCGDCCCCLIVEPEPDYSMASRPSRSTNTSCCRCSNKCCCCFITALTTIALATLVVMLVVAYAAVPARVTVEYAFLSRFALTNGTALAYDVSLAIAVRNRNFATGAWRAAPLDAELRFRGQTFARASAQLESAEWGLSKARGKGLYRVTAADSGVALGGDGVVAEFVKESVAGVFEIEAVVVGGEAKYEEGQHHGRDTSVRVTCPLKLSVPTANKAVRLTSVKCS